MANKQDKYNFEASNILAYIIKRFKVLMIISFGAAVIAAIASLFIHNRYKSGIVLFPASQNSVARSIVDLAYGYSKGEQLAVGEDEEVDELMQVLYSNDISSHLVQKFDLFNHYKINPTSKAASKKLYDKLTSNLKINRTEYSSVTVEVWDEDPFVAANMANEIASYTDTVFKNMERQKTIKAYKIAQLEYDSLNNYINSRQDSISKFNKLGVLDYEFQTQELTKAYYKALMKDKKDIAKAINSKIEILQKYGSKAATFRDEIKLFQRNLAEMNTKVTTARVALNNDIPHKYVLNKAFASDYKDTPKRSIIVLVAALAAFFFSLLGFIVFENIKKII